MAHSELTGTLPVRSNGNTSAESLGSSSEQSQLSGRLSIMSNAPLPSPHRGLSAYMFWAHANRDRVRSANPDASFGEVGMILGNEWKALREAGGEAEYVKMAEDDQARYIREKAAYDAARSENRSEDTLPAPTAGGTLSSLKVLYEGTKQCDCCINWVEEPPTDLEVRIEDREESKGHAVLVRKRKNHGEGGNTLLLDSIVVQSRALKEMLGEVFKDYLGIHTTLRKLVFKPPFHEFYFERTRFDEICAAQPDPTRSQARLLQSVLEEELSDTIATSEDLACNGVVTFDYLWTIFRVGTDIYSSQLGYDCVYKLTGVKYKQVGLERALQLEVCYVNCDGKEYGWDTTTLLIRWFPGTRPVNELDAMPLSSHQHPDKLHAKLTARGKAFRDYTQPKYNYAAYKGLFKDPNGKKHSVDGRIVLDESEFAMFNTSQKLLLNPITSLTEKENLDLGEKRHHGSRSSTRSMSPPVMVRGRRRRSIYSESSSRGSSRDMPEKEEQRSELEDTFLIYCCAEVRGYCLKTKKWGAFAVDSVRPVRWNRDAFDALVMAPDLKRMILSFVESQAETEDPFDDIIEGKGRGIILLLEGSPGVGKTLTAEAVADKLHRPLYAISGGELGLDADELEESLQTILDVAAKWNTVLLLDECDVFLEKRGIDDMRRNSIVAVFLRILEYYNGILFMTTNRVNTIDPAFNSRIHLTVRYPDLDFEARKQVWKRFLDTFCHESKMTMRDVQELAEEELNGREIKNLVKTAQLLAKHEKVPLAMVHVKTVLGVTKRKPTIGVKKAA